MLREPGGGSRRCSPSTDTQKPVGGLIVHRGTLHGRLRVGETVEAVVDAERRAHTMRNHTGTHLLHRALRNVVGERARQAGSLVTPDYLRFDFPFDRALTDDEQRGDRGRGPPRSSATTGPSRSRYMTMPEAIDAGADAFFDEKYGETVRTVRVEGYSLELCGGTHCRATGQIGGFVITGERIIGSGMRRIEAVTGAGADAWYDDRLDDARARRARPPARQTPDALAGPDRRAPGRAARDEAAAQGGRRERACRSRASSPRGAEEVAPGVRLVAFAGPYESMDALKGAAKDVRGSFGVGRHRARPRRRRAAALRDRQRRPRRARHRRPATSSRAAVAAIDGRGGGRPEMAQGKGTRREGLAEALAAIRDARSTRRPEA